MKYSQAEMGRIFVIRLEHGEILHKEIEEFALKKSVKAGFLIVIGGADKGSKLVTGPEDGNDYPVTPINYILQNVHEAAGTGTIFPDKKGKPIVHLHLACGRNEQTKTGCIRQGVKVWEVMEVILVELEFSRAKRLYEEKTGLELLNPEGKNTN